MFPYLLVHLLHTSFEVALQNAIYQRIKQKYTFYTLTSYIQKNHKIKTKCLSYGFYKCLKK